MYRQILDPVAHSLAWSSLVAALPLAVLFVMLGVLRVRAWVASLVSLAVALAVAIAVYRMPIGQAALQPLGIGPGVLAAAHAAALADVDDHGHAGAVERGDEALAVEAVHADRRDSGHRRLCCPV